MTRTRALPFKCSAAITDVDDTLVIDDKRITTRTTSAVVELRANEIVFSIISNCLPWGLRPLLEPLGLTTPIASFNGGEKCVAELSIITEHLLSPAVAPRRVDMLNAHRAMGNASPEVRRAVVFVTDGNCEEGFVNAVRHFIFVGDRQQAEAARIGGRA